MVGIPAREELAERLGYLRAERGARAKRVWEGCVC